MQIQHGLLPRVRIATLLWSKRNIFCKFRDLWETSMSRQPSGPGTWWAKTSQGPQKIRSAHILCYCLQSFWRKWSWIRHLFYHYLSSKLENVVPTIHVGKSATFFLLPGHNEVCLSWRKRSVETMSFSDLAQWPKGKTIKVPSMSYWPQTNPLVQKHWRSKQPLLLRDIKKHLSRSRSIVFSSHQGSGGLAPTAFREKESLHPFHHSWQETIGHEPGNTWTPLFKSNKHQHGTGVNLYITYITYCCLHQ